MNPVPRPVRCVIALCPRGSTPQPFLFSTIVYPAILSTTQTLTIQTRPSIMSTNLQSARPLTDTFTTIFKAASDEYQRITGKRLDSHPFATLLDTCHSPDAVSAVLRTQAQTFGRFCKGDDNLMAWLDPSIKILWMLSATLGEGIGLVSRLIHFLSLFSQHTVLSYSHPRE